MSSRFIRPDTTVLKISQGDTLTVKRRLTTGEQRAQYARLYVAGLDGRLRVNPLESGMAVVTAYLIDWSLTDDDGKRVEIRGLSIEELTNVINGMDPESFGEIRAAIEAHELAMVAEREKEKNVQAGEMNGSVISPSPSEHTGPSSASVN